MFGNLGQAKKYLGQAAKMLIGIPTTTSRICKPTIRISRT